jgi:hypothetical protein
MLIGENPSNKGSVVGGKKSEIGVSFFLNLFKWH